MVSITLRFPLGVYHAQAQSDFAGVEWPPHPVRLIAALVAAAHAGPAHDIEVARSLIDRLARADAPFIVAPRRQGDSRLGSAGSSDADDDRGAEHAVAVLRGASRWAPRNHELGELQNGISPRDLGRGRAEVQKVGVGIGDLPVTFTWPALELSSGEETVLHGLADDVTFVGTARSPVLVAVTTAPDDVPDRVVAWRPVEDGTTTTAVPVRVPDARTLMQLDRWHERRSAPASESGAPAKAPLVVAPRLGSVVAYAHDADPRPELAFDPEHWGDMLLLVVTGDVTPMAPATFALARATRKALLDTYAARGAEGDAPPILRGRGGDPHAAFVPLSHVAPLDDDSPGGRNADGHVMGVAVLLPHPSRVRDLSAQREAVVDGLTRLVLESEVLVPGVGSVTLAPHASRRPPKALQESRYRTSSTRWTTVTPLVHSRYRTAKSRDALLSQVAAECSDVGLPAPKQVSVRRGARLRGAPEYVTSQGLPPSWTGPLKGPQAHLDVWFDRPIHGPIVLGRARHFGLGLCLPFVDSEPAR